MDDPAYRDNRTEEEKEDARKRYLEQRGIREAESAVRWMLKTAEGTERRRYTSHDPL